MGNSGEAAEKYISSGGRTLLFALLFASCVAAAAAQAEDLIVGGTTRVAAAKVDVCAIYGFRAIITADTTWTADKVYVANGCHIEVEQGATLTIEPGTIVRIGGICYHSKGCSFAVRGTLQAQGTASQPIAITSVHDDSRGGPVTGSSGTPAAGDWYGLHFAAGSRGRLDHLFLGYGGSREVAEYGGASKWNDGQLEIFDADVELLNSEIDSGLIHGIYLGPYNATTVRARIENTRISRHRWHQQDAYQAAYAIVQTTINMDVTYRALTFSDNDGDGVTVQTARLTRDATLGGAPFLLESCGYTACSIYIPTGKTLTVLPGTTIQLAKHWDVEVTDGGSLLAEGTPAAPITFARLEQPLYGTGGQPANWLRLLFEPGSRARLSYCDISKGGGYYQNMEAVRIKSSDVRIRHCRIHDNPRTTNGAVYVTDNAQPLLRYNEIFGNGLAIRNYAYPDFGPPVDARFNWWGDATGPKHARLNPDGLGDEVSNGVSFDPWLKTFNWLDVEDALFHDAEPLSWATYGVDPTGLTVDIHAYGAGESYVLGTGLPPTGPMSWQSRGVPDGRYELRATLRDASGGTVADATRSITVNNASGLVWHGGRITGTETWAAGVIHVVETDVDIESGAQVVIEPGALVKFAPTTQIVAQSGGRLTISATPAMHAVLTALADDTGGDTNLDGAQSIPRAGNWRGVTAHSTGVLEIGADVEIRYASLTHSGTLAQSDTWASSRLHLVTGDVTVPAGVTLTIEPGAQIKVETHQAIIVQAGGRLVAPGTVAQPIVFTSSRDDAVGGDSDGDAGAVPPAAGDWRGLQFAGGQGDLDHVTIAYAGGSGSGSWDTTAGAVSTTPGAVVSLSNSRLLDPYFEGVLAWGGGDVTIVNTVIAGADRAVNSDRSAVVRLTNCTIDDSRIGIWGHSGRLEVSNTIISNSFEAGIDNVLSSPLTLRYSDVWSSRGSNYVRMADQTGTNGNISRDPHYVDREHGDYRLDYRSPAIDAADGPAAPATDVVGSPRYDDPRTPNTGIATGGGAYADMGAYEFVETANSNLDLVVSSVSGPTTAVAGEKVRVQWTVTNIGSGQVVGPWHDTVNLVLSPDANPTVIFAAEVLVGEGTRLGPGQSVSTSAEIRVPGSIVAEHRWQVVTNTRGEVFEGRNRENNTGLSLSPVAVDLPELIIGGAALSRQFDSVGQAHWFKFVPSAGQDVIVRLDRAGTGGSTELYIAQGYMPSRERFDTRQNEVNAPDVSTLAASTSTQTYYVLAYPVSLPGGAASFTISTRALDFALESVGPQQVGNSGRATLTVHGGQLSSDMIFEIVDSHGGVHAAQSVFLSNSSLAYVTFDLSGIPVGAYSLRVRDGARTATLAGGVNVIAGVPGKVEARLTMPKAMRPDWTETLTVEYANSGSTDVVAPLIFVQVENCLLRLPGESEFTHRVAQLLGVNPQGPAGVLPPGARGLLSLELQPSINNGKIRGRVSVLKNPNEPIDWAARKTTLRPEFVPADAWDAIFANFTQSVGNTYGGYQSALASAATSLSSLGEVVSDTHQLLTMLFNRAGIGELSRRYRLGPFGRGVTVWWQLKAVTEASGNVRIEAGAPLRYFRKRLDGSYETTVRERSTLTLSGGIYRMQELDGTVISFRSDGSFNFAQSRNGNRVTATYSGGTLVGIADNTGDTISYVYDAHGRITQSTDPVGRVTMYSYDAAGEHLLTVSNAQGTTAFSYVQGAGAAREHALQSIGLSDGTHVSFEYDDMGWQTRALGDGGEQAIGYGYDSNGAVTVTDASGYSVKKEIERWGRPARIISGTSDPTTVTYDDNGLPTRVSGPGGFVISLSRAADGTLTSLTDPLGSDTRFAGDANFDAFASITAAGRPFADYTFDAAGNVAGLASGGGSEKHLEHDSHGWLTGWTNARGQTSHRTYDSRGVPVEIVRPGGTHRVFAYDQHRNLVSATEGASAVHLDYDTADRLTKITYPSGRFLTFTYDGGGRRIGSVDQDGLGASYAYDQLGRLVTVTDTGGHLLARYEWDHAGRLSSRGAGNGTTTTYEYGASGQVDRVTTRGPDNGVLSQSAYVYDEVGRATQTDTLSGRWRYTYDAADRLLSARFDSTNSAVPSTVLSYAYDANGNRVSATRDGAVIAYATNLADQYLSAGDASFAYDADGNLQSRRQGAEATTYTYDEENRLTAIQGPEGSWAFEYDPLGNRIAATHDGVRTEYLIDPLLSMVVGAYTEGASAARFLYGAGLVARIGAEGTAYYDFDHTGNTTLITDQSAHVLNTYVYAPFGDLLASEEALPQPFRFSGQLGVMADGSGLYFMRARHFDPSMGRFLQRDPTGIAGGFNPYAYAANDPVNAIDPFGTNPLPNWVFTQSLTDAILDVTGNKVLALAAEKLAGLNLGKMIQFIPEGPRRQAVLAAWARGLEGWEGWAKAGKTAREATQVVRTVAQTGARAVTTAAAETTATAGAAAGGTTVMGAAAAAGWAIIGWQTAAWTFTTVGDWVSWENLSTLGGGMDLALTSEGVSTAWDCYSAGIWDCLFGDGDVVTSHDPNDLIGPAGNGTAHWIAPDQTLPYKIRFENDKQATAPAQAVRITTQLDPDLDYTTFQLGSFNFDGVVVTVPPGRTFYSERLDLRSTHGLYLDITANLDFDTGIVTWVFASVDPVTGRTPRDPLTGFLPPNVTSPIGEGYVIYTIRPRSSSSIGTPISAEASIVFDTNDPIDTPQHQNPVGPIADCTGDCNSGGQVTVDELLTMVNIALGNSQVQACIAGDMNTDGLVTIDEILTAVNYALNGCPVQIATPPTPSPTRTTPPSPSVTVPPIVTATPSRTPTATATFTRSATATATRTVAASATPTASATLTPTRSATPTQTVAASVTPSATPTRTIAPATVTPTPTRTTFPVSPTPTGTVGFVTPTVQPPLTPTPTRTVSGTPATPSPTRTPGAHVYCDTLSSPLAIPDGNEFGISDQITIADNVPITALRVEVQIDHTWVGDLAVNLAHVNTLTLTTLIFRPGGLPYGCSGDNIACTFDDTAATHADNQCADPPPAIAGTVAPMDPLSVFNGESSAGEWMLAVSDHGVGDTGSLVHWCVEVQ